MYRERELNQLHNNLKNSVNTFLWGSLGSGKTNLIKRVIKDLTTEDIRYVNCILYDTSFSVLREIMPSAKLILQKSIYELIKRLTKEVRQKRLWICFDNFVHLKDVGIITKVMSLGINIILVSNIKRDAEVLNLNVLSNIPCIIKLHDYTIKQCFNILKDRARKAFVKSSFKDELLMETSKRSKGNIALAINILRTAALKAQGENRKRIEITDLSETLYPPSNPGNLGEDEKVLLEILKEKIQLTSGELFALYKQRITSPKGERSFRNYMENLCSKGFVRATGTNRWRVYVLTKSDEDANRCSCEGRRRS